jgi:hypothetical protein
MLVIIAAILVLVAIARINGFAGNLTATMTEAALSRVDLPSRDVLANLQNLTEEVRMLGDTLRGIREGETPALQSEIAKLKDALSTLSANVDRLTNARTILTDEAIGRLGQSVTDTLATIRGCASRVRSDRLPTDGAIDLRATLAGFSAGLRHFEDVAVSPTMGVEGSPSIQRYKIQPQPAAANLPI